MPSKNDPSSRKRSSCHMARYKGLFTSRIAPTSRAYCILFSFFAGVLLITTGSVFFHVILMHPMSGMEPMHTPPVPLACGLIGSGIILILLSFGIAWKFGFDDGDDSLEDELLSKEDVLDQHYQQCPSKSPSV